MLINTANLRAVNQGFQSLFDAARNRTASQYDQIAMTVPSTRGQTVYAWLGKFPGIREWLGARVLQNLGASDFTIKNKPFEGTIAVDRNDILDDEIGVYKPQIELLGEATKTFPDKLIFRLLLDGFSSLCYDGQYFFDTDHPVLDKNGIQQSVANTDGGNGTPWFLLDVNRAIRPIIWQKREEFNFVAMDRPEDEGVFMNRMFRYGVDGRGNAGYGLWQLAWGSKQALDTAHYGAARAALMSMTMDGGEPLGVMPNLLLVPPSLEAAAFAVVQAEKLANLADNPYKGTAKVVVCPWLAAV